MKIELEEQIDSWVSGIKPDIVKKIDKLEKASLVPMHLDNPNFSVFNVLNSWIFWKGSFRELRPGVYQAKLNYDTQEEYQTLKQLVDEVGYPAKERDSFFSMSGPITKMISLWGMPTVRDSDSVAPEYILKMHARDDLRCDDPLKTFVSCLLYLRGEDSSHGVEAELNSFDNKNSSRVQALLIREIAREFYSEDVSMNGPNLNSKGKYSSRLVFPGAKRRE